MRLAAPRLWRPSPRRVAVLFNQQRGISQEVVELRSKLLNASADIRAHAAWALGDMGHPTKLAIPELTANLTHSDRFVRREATWALSKTGELANEVLPYVSERLMDEFSWVRRAAAETLGGIGQVTSSTAETLVNTTADDHCFVRWAAVRALMGATARDHLKTLRAREKDPLVYAAITEVLTKQKKSLTHQAIGIQQVTELRNKLVDEDPDILAQAAWALGDVAASGLIEPTYDAIPHLVSMLDSDDDLVRVEATFALGKIGRSDTVVLGGLVKNLADRDSGVRRAAIDALGGLGDSAASYLMDISAALSDDHLFVRWAAAKVLADLGKPAKAAINDLKSTLAKESDVLVQLSLESALTKLTSHVD